MTNYETVVQNILDGKYPRTSLHLISNKGNFIDSFDIHVTDAKTRAVVALQYKDVVNALVVNDISRFNPEAKGVVLFITTNEGKNIRTVRAGLNEICRLAESVGDITLITIANGELLSTQYAFSERRKLKDNPLYNRSMNRFNTKAVASLYNNSNAMIIKPYDSDRNDNAIAEKVESIRTIDRDEFTNSVINNLYGSVAMTKNNAKRKTLVK